MTTCKQLCRGMVVGLLHPNSKGTILPHNSCLLSSKLPNNIGHLGRSRSSISSSSSSSNLDGPRHTLDFPAVWRQWKSCMWTLWSKDRDIGGVTYPPIRTMAENEAQYPLFVAWKREKKTSYCRLKNLVDCLAQSQQLPPRLPSGHGP